MTFFTAAYRLLAPRRRLLFTLSVALLALSGLLFAGVETREDIEAMLPDGASSVAADFRLLQQAPFARKVVVDLAAGEGTGTADLLAAADRLAAALEPPLFTRAFTGPGEVAGEALVSGLLEMLPNLLGEDELAALEAWDGSGIRRQLEEDRRLLLSPEGWALKGLVRHDPLELRALALARLQHLKLIPGVRIESGHFVSADGRHALVVAETPVPITDSAGGEELLRRIETLTRQLPGGIKATVVSGHRYSLANAEAIKGDLRVILACSSFAILVLFLIFLRSWRALFVYLLPVSVLCAAAVAVSLFYPAVSAVTIGFGAVLLGITIDYGLHVYFALRRGGEPGVAVGEVARPVLFGGLTTLAAFAVLLWSDLPGQRQLAVFAAAGIGLSLLLALTVLPHLLPVAEAPVLRSTPDRRGAGRRWVLAAWIAVLLAGGWQMRLLGFDGNLRTLSLVPAELKAAEAQVRGTWGDLRGQAMIFVDGKNLEEALAANAGLFDYLRQRPEAGEIVSLAPLLPPAAAQQASRDRWQAFWQGEKGKGVLAALEAEASALGFAPAAFAPFIDLIRQPAAPVDLEALRLAGLGEAAAALMSEDGGRVRIMTLVPDGPGVIDLQRRDPAWPASARLVSQSRFGAEVGTAIGRDFLRFLSLAAAAVTGLLVLLFRSGRKVLLALVPVATGLVAAFGAMGTFGIGLTIFNVIAASLIIGLGVDYGIFMVCRLEEGRDPATERAVLVSGLTTLAGFGALVLGRHPALHSIGLTVLLGIGAAIPAALLVVPALAWGRKS